MYINFFISLPKWAQQRFLHPQPRVGGAKNRQWEQLHKLALVLGSDTGSSSLQLLSSVTLHKLSASWCNSSFAVLLWSCSAYWWSPSHTPGMASRKCNSVQWISKALCLDVVRKRRVNCCGLCPLPTPILCLGKGTPSGVKIKVCSKPQRGLLCPCPTTYLCSSHRNASTSSLRRSTWNV